MELKKSPKADLEKKKGLFMEVGLIVALLLCIGLFSISQAKITFNPEIAPMPALPDEEIIEITREPEKVETQAPKASVQITSDIINIVRDDQKIEANLVFDDFMEDAIISFDANAGGGGGYSTDDEALPFAMLQDQPTFPGGDFQKWVQNNATYPPAMLAMNIAGRVTLSFVIEMDGSLSNIQAIASPHQGLSDAAIALLKSAPKWTPGKQRGRAVRVAFQTYVDYVITM